MIKDKRGRIKCIRDGKIAFISPIFVKTELFKSLGWQVIETIEDAASPDKLLNTSKPSNTVNTVISDNPEKKNSPPGTAEDNKFTLNYSSESTNKLKQTKTK